MKPGLQLHTAFLINTKRISSIGPRSDVRPRGLKVIAIMLCCLGQAHVSHNVEEITPRRKFAAPCWRSLVRSIVQLPARTDPAGRALFPCRPRHIDTYRILQTIRYVDFMFFKIKSISRYKLLLCGKRNYNFIFKEKKNWYNTLFYKLFQID